MIEEVLNKLPPSKCLNGNIHIERYKKFIFSRNNRKIESCVKTHKHHIIPKSMGGDDCLNNLIELTIREHYIAHLILYKAYKGKMATAFWYMTNITEGKVSGRLYEVLSIEQAKYSSLVNKGRFSGEKNPAKRKEVAAKISATQKERGISKGKNNPNYGGKYGTKGKHWVWSDDQKEYLKKIRKSQKPYKRDHCLGRKFMVNWETLDQVIVKIEDIPLWEKRGYKIGRKGWKRKPK